MFQHWMRGGVTKLSLHSVAIGRVSSTFVSWFCLELLRKVESQSSCQAAMQTIPFTRNSPPRRYFFMVFHIFSSVSHCYSMLWKKGSPQKAIQCSLCTTWTMDNLQELPKFDGTTMNNNGFPCFFPSSQVAPKALLDISQGQGQTHGGAGMG